MKENWGYILFCVSFFVAVGSVIFVVQEKNQKCDEVVFIEGELGIDARHISSFSNGMSVIRLCDGTNLQVPTHRIIKIVDKDIYMKTQQSTR